MRFRAQCGFRGKPELLFIKGPTLQVQVGLDTAAFVLGPSVQPDLPELKIPALVDTGASVCCIDSQLAKDLNLPFVGKKKMSGIKGPSMHSSYLGQIYIPALSFTLYGILISVDLVAGGQEHGVLLGRDFLGNFQMVYDGVNGVVSIGRVRDRLGPD